MPTVSPSVFFTSAGFTQSRFSQSRSSQGPFLKVSLQVPLKVSLQAPLKVCLNLEAFCNPSHSSSFRTTNLESCANKTHYKRVLRVCLLYVSWCFTSDSVYTSY